MSEQVRQYVAIDAKSFYASVECVERQLNPLTTHLVVADESRTEKDDLSGRLPGAESARCAGPSPLI